VTDLETIKQILNTAEIVYKVGKWEEFLTINIGAQDGPNNEGYFGFKTQLSFDQNGKLKTVGAWE
jgi:hypothetical protein